jgi:hypothetical protein
LELKNFFITGYNTLATHGADHHDFDKPKKIFSGHFHKRQANDNVVYIGNTFPMDYGDADDNERGMCIYDTNTDTVDFINWEDAPSYKRIKISKIVDGWKPKKKMKVTCEVDIEMSYSESMFIKETYVKDYELREFIIQETYKKELLEEELNSEQIKKDIEGLSNIDDLILEDLTSIKDSKNIKGSVLADIYKDLVQ